MKLVEITWVDITADNSGWRSHEHHANVPLLQVTSVGYVLREDRNVVAIVQSLGSNGLVAESLTIPRSVIKKIRRLR